MSLRRTHRQDLSQKKMVESLRRVPHLTVALTTGVGFGFPDAIIGYKGHTYMVEIKSPGGDLRASQILWLAKWRGAPVILAETAEDVLRAMGVSA